jgi:hypothetical protein
MCNTTYRTHMWCVHGQMITMKNRQGIVWLLGDKLSLIVSVYIEHGSEYKIISVISEQIHLSRMNKYECKTGHLQVIAIVRIVKYIKCFYELEIQVTSGSTHNFL